MEKQRWYAAIDLKSFYASVECMERGVDPLSTYLVVADESRTDKTICLAVSPALKAWGVSGRARLFEAFEQVRKVNAERKTRAPGQTFTGTTTDDQTLKKHPELAIDFIRAVPRMALYMQYSAHIYALYLEFVAPEDIFAYSVDEVFINLTPYLALYEMTPEELTMAMVRHVLAHTGITATAGVGTNLYLAKIAMDIRAKHMAPDAGGVRLATLDEAAYRHELWTHRPLTDFWRIGPATARKLEAHGMTTMGDVARCSVGGDGDYLNEDLLYKLFGINAELLIDHAWGWEPTTIADVKHYRPRDNSLSSGQVLTRPYPYDQARIVLREMAEDLALDLVRRKEVCDQIVVDVGYDKASLERTDWRGPVALDHYGRRVPHRAHGSRNLGGLTSSSSRIVEAAMAVFDRIADPALLVRRLNVSAVHVKAQDALQAAGTQQTLFDEASGAGGDLQDPKERRCQEAMLKIQARFGKNAILKGTSLQEGATAKTRNEQIGGHRA